MEENMKYIFSDIRNSTKDIENIIKSLSNIKCNTLVMGSGGSKVVAEFIRLVLSKKNNIIINSIDAADISQMNIKLYDNIIISSYSGKNYGVKHLLNYDLQGYLLTTRKTKINKEILLSYDMEYRHSFISLNQTIVPMAIMLKYYLGDDFDEIIDLIEELLDKTINIEIKDVTNIYTSYNTSASSRFIESTLAESGLSAPVIHAKYDYCHGRSTLNKDNDYSSIILINNKLDIDRLIIDIWSKRKNTSIFLKGPFKDEIVNDFYLTLQSMFLLCNIARSKNIDLSNIEYDKEVVKKVYYFKGSM